MLEHYFQCPHCWEEISMLLDPAQPHQSYIEDCEICCQPIQITVDFQNREIINFQTDTIDQ